MYHDNAIDTLANRLDTYITFNMYCLEKKTRYAYKRDRPTYLVGKFECMYQFAYQIIDADNVQDAIDFIMDDLRYYNEKYSIREQIEIPFVHGYMDMCRGISRFISAASYGYYNDPNNNEPIKHIFSIMNFDDIAKAIN